LLLRAPRRRDRQEGGGEDARDRALNLPGMHADIIGDSATCWEVVQR
jgi:hypothetical protein